MRSSIVEVHTTRQTTSINYASTQVLGLLVTVVADYEVGSKIDLLDNPPNAYRLAGIKASHRPDKFHTAALLRTSPL